jgi:glycosyltransferase involved in cell wall biosynthesis
VEEIFESEEDADVTGKQSEGVCFFGGYAEDYPRSGVIKRGIESLGVRVSSCRTPPRRKIFSRYPMLVRRYWRMRKDFSVVFVPEFRHKDVPLAWLLGRLTGKRVVFDPLVSRYETKIVDRGDAGAGSFQSWYNRRIDSLSLRLPDLVFADTQTHADHFRTDFNAQRLSVLPVGFDDAVFERPGDARMSETNGPATILFFGSYVPLHGVESIVDAAALLRSRAGIRFSLIGEGQTFAEAQRRAARSANIEFLPRVAYEELPSLIERAALCLGIFGTSAKASRVVPNKVYQCLAMGKPVITADSPAVREFFQDGEHLFLVPPGDGAALADKIVYLLEHPDAARSAARKGSELVWSQFSSSSIGRRFIDAVADIRGNRRSS